MCPIEERNFVENILKEAELKDGEKLLTDEELKRVEYLCVVHELETLFLFDAHALSEYFESRTKRRYKVQELPKPGYRTRPKIVLRGIFERHLGKDHPYNDRIDAERLIKIVNIDKLKNCAPYQKFKKRVLGF